MFSTLSKRRLLTHICLVVWMSNAACAQFPGAGAGGNLPGGMGGYGMEAMNQDQTMQIVVDGPDFKPLKVTSQEHREFSYALGSLRPNPVARATGGGGYGGMMGGAGGGDMGAMGGMSGGGGYGGMPGGEGFGEMGGYGEAGFGMYAGDPGNIPQATQARRIQIRAYIFQLDSPRDKIELVLPATQAAGQDRSARMGGGGYGGQTGAGDDLQAGAVTSDLGLDGSVTVGNALPLGDSPGAEYPSGFVSLERAVDEFKLMPALEAEIVAALIRQSLWKEDMIQQLHRNLDNADELAKLEVELKALLTEEYRTQLARQEREIHDIEQRIRGLRDELARRRAAMPRVVDVQLGNIVLEAQGLLRK